MKQSMLELTEFKCHQHCTCSLEENTRLRIA